MVFNKALGVRTYNVILKFQYLLWLITKARYLFGYSLYVIRRTEVKFTISWHQHGILGMGHTDWNVTN